MASQAAADLSRTAQACRFFTTLLWGHCGDKSPSFLPLVQLLSCCCCAQADDYRFKLGRVAYAYVRPVLRNPVLADIRIPPSGSTTVRQNRRVVIFSVLRVSRPLLPYQYDGRAKYPDLQCSRILPARTTISLFSCASNISLDTSLLSLACLSLRNLKYWMLFGSVYANCAVGAEEAVDTPLPMFRPTRSN